MKNFYIFFIAMTLIFASVSSTKADLFDSGYGLIYDDDLNITWLQNANYAGSTMSWSEANTWVENLVFQGYDDWRLPSFNCSGNNCTGSEMGQLFFTESVTSESPGLFMNVKPYMYWSGTEYDLDTSRAWRFNFKNGSQGTSSKTYKRYAWAVRDGESAPPVIPEPVSSILFVTGGATLGFRQLCKKRKTT